MEMEKLIRMGLQASYHSAKSYDWYRKNMKKTVGMARKAAGLKNWDPEIAKVRELSAKTVQQAGEQMKQLAGHVPAKKLGKAVSLAAGGAVLATACVKGSQYIKSNYIQNGYLKKGNQSAYSVAATPIDPEHDLTGKRIIFLGSSVTKGYASHDEAFPDYISKMSGCEAVKETVNGTTLVDIEEKSYVERMRSLIPKDIQADLFVCQLSTNDASRGCPLGQVSESERMEDFDTTTICGAIEYIICYARETWKCPVMFYTGPVYESETYANMVEALLKIQEKWGIELTDFWHMEEVNKTLDSDRNLYMSDPIHPMRAGYQKIFCPIMLQKICQILV